MNGNPFDEPSPSVAPSPVLQANPFDEPKQPDMSGMKKYIQANLKDYKEGQGETAPQGQPLPPGESSPHYAKGYADAFIAGIQGSSGGLMARAKLPDTVLPENAGMAMRIASQAGGVIGDIPAMIAGGAMGGAVGAAVASPTLAVPVAGEAATVGAAGYGAAAGAFAVPAAIRRYYVDRLQKGEVKDFGDLWERTAGIAWDATKGAVIGMATAGAGGVAATALEKTALPALAQGGGKLAAELATMTTVGKGMEGEVPTPTDFAEGAILLGGFHAVSHVLPAPAKNVQEKLQNIYAETGMKPAEVGVQAATDPILKQELLSTGTQVPKSLDDFVQKPGINEDKLGIDKPEMVDAKIPEHLLEPAPGLSDKFLQDEKYSIENPKEEIPKEKSQEQLDEERKAEPEKTALLDRIGTEAGNPRPTLRQIYTRALDSLNPIKQIQRMITGEENPDVQNSAYALKRLAGASSGKAQIFIDHGPRDFETGKATGTPGLREILAPHKGDIDGLEAYMIGRRSIDLEERGVETGVPQDEAKKYVADNFDKYEKTFQKVVNFRNESMTYLKDAGIISEKSFNAFKDNNPNAIPFIRIVEGEKIGGAGGGKSLRPIKSIEGSSAQIVSPIKSIIQETFARLQIADNNRAASKLIDVSQSSEIGREFVKKVPTPIKTIEVQPEEIQKHLSNYGLDNADPGSFDIYRKMVGPLKSDEIAVMREGKREVYNVGEDVANAFNKTNEPPNIIMKAFSIPAKMIRTGAVETMDFLARHFIRDNANAFVLSNNGYVPVIDALRGLKSWFKEDADYQNWMAGGGGMSGISDLDKNYIQPKILELSKDTGLMDKVTNLVKNPLEIFRTMANAITSAPRIGEFIRAQEAGKDILQSAYEARSITIDNQRMGSDPAVRAMSMINAFWNTRIQGVDRLVQAFKDNPARTAGKLGLSVTLPSVLLWSVNHDDPRYKDLPDWQKDLFWIVLTKDHVFRIPKPFEGGILFGSSVERMLDAYYAHNPDAFHGFGRAVTEGAIPSMIPTAFMPAIEQFGNRSSLTGGNIIPHALEGVAPAYQYTPYTSETAKAIGKVIGYLGGSAVHEEGSKHSSLASPMVVQNYIRAWGGGMGQYMTEIIDKGLEASGIVNPPPKPASTLADMPFIKAFVVRYPGMNSQNIQNFYDNVNKSQETMDTISSLIKRGDPKAAYDYRNSPEAKANMENLKGYSKTVSEMSHEIQRIDMLPTMTPNDKRQAIDGLYYKMIEIARQGNQMARDFQERVKNQNKH